MAPETVLGENILDFRPSRHRAPLSATPPERASHSPSTVPRRATKKLSHRRFPPGGTSISPRGDVLSWYPRGDLISVSLFLVVPPGVPRPQVPLGGRRRQKTEKEVSEWKPAVSKSGEGRFQNGNRPFPEWDETHYLCNPYPKSI